MERNNFEVLVLLDRLEKEKVSANDISEKTNLSLDEVVSVITQLSEFCLIDKNLKLTELAYIELAPYRVKRAVFFAAGFGSRLIPITYNTPKPLIRVNGTRMIDTLLDAVLSAGIEDITIVRGYLKEQFDTLLPKYPMIKFVDNDYYDEANNISSAILVKDLFENALILESDLIISDPSIIRKYEFSTNYRVKKVSSTDDWCLDTIDGVVNKVKIGGDNTNEMIGISYWNEEDGKKLSKHLEEAYNSPGGKELFWDEVSLKKYPEDYKINVFEVSDDSIVEVDTFAELCEIDSIYTVK